MNTPDVPPVIQAVGLACVPIADMPPGSTLARKPVAAAIISLIERGDGHRDVVITCVSDARDMEFPLPVLVNDALVATAPTIITAADCETLAVDATSRRFFVEARLAALADGDTLIDPVAIFGNDHDEAALCHRLGFPVALVSDNDIARWWNRAAPAVAEGLALTAAIARLMLWAHGTAFRSGRPDAFFETLIPLRERLLDIECERPELKAILAMRPFGRVASLAGYYHEYRARRDGGEHDARWLTFEDGLSYV